MLICVQVSTYNDIYYWDVSLNKKLLFLECMIILILKIAFLTCEIQFTTKIVSCSNSYII